MIGLFAVAVVWTIKTMQMGRSLPLAHTLTGSDARFYCVAFSGDGKLVAAGTDGGRVFVWDVETGDPKLSFRAHTDVVSAVAFTGDGSRVISGSSDRTARVWDSSTGLELATFAHDDSVTALCVSSDGKTLATETGSGVVRLWDLASKQSRVIFDPEGSPWPMRGFNTVRACGIAFQKGDGRLALALRGWLLLIDVRSLAVRAVGESEESAALPPAFSADGTRLFGVLVRQGEGHIWDVASGQEIGSFPIGAHFAVSPANGTVALGHTQVADWPSYVSFWNPETKAETGKYVCHGTSLTALAWSPDGRLLATATWDGTVKLWRSPDEGR
jgi:WD40 repeat protein